MFNFQRRRKNEYRLEEKVIQRSSARRRPCDHRGVCACANPRATHRVPRRAQTNGTAQANGGPTDGRATDPGSPNRHTTPGDLCVLQCRGRRSA